MTDQSGLSKTLELTARAGAVVVLATYGAGFVVVSVRQGALGIAQFDLFKPRLLAAGILFWIFLCLSLLAAARSFGLLSFPSSFVQRDSSEHWRLHVVASRALLLLLSCVVLAVLAAIFFKLDELIASGLKSTWPASGFGVAVGCLFLIRFWALERRFLCFLLAVLGVAVLVLSLYKFGNPDFLLRTCWFLFASLWFVWLTARLPEVKRLEGVHGEMFFVQLIVLASIFATYLYPHINASFGGGSAAPMTIQFSGLSPFGEAEKVKAWYIDENERGYYILLSETSKKAVFLPRDRVSAIYFGEAAETFLPIAPNATPSERKH